MEGGVGGKLVLEIEGMSHTTAIGEKRVMEGKCWADNNNTSGVCVYVYVYIYIYIYIYDQRKGGGKIIWRTMDMKRKKDYFYNQIDKPAFKIWKAMELPIARVGKYNREK